MLSADFVYESFVFIYDFVATLFLFFLRLVQNINFPPVLLEYNALFSRLAVVEMLVVFDSHVLFIC